MKNKPLIRKESGYWVCSDKSQPAGSRNLSISDNPKSAYQNWCGNKESLQPFFIGDIIAIDSMEAIVMQTNDNGALLVKDLKDGHEYGLCAKYCTLIRKPRTGEAIYIPSTEKPTPSTEKPKTFWDWLFKR